MTKAWLPSQVQFNLFAGTILALGTPEQARPPAPSRIRVEPPMMITSPSQIVPQLGVLVQISIDYLMFRGDMCIAVEFPPYMARGRAMIERVFPDLG